jgi:hypothetical protein
MRRRKLRLVNSPPDSPSTRVMATAHSRLVRMMWPNWRSSSTSRPMTTR